MRPTENEFKRAVQTISAMKYFPASDPGVKTEVLDLLAVMVDTSENLEWLRVTLRDKVHEWPGPAEIRAIYCTSKRPADGIEGCGYSTVAGFTPGDIERENIEAPRDDYARLNAGASLRQIAAGIPEVAEVATEPVQVARWREEARERRVAVQRHDEAERQERENRRAKIAEEFDRMQAEKILKGVQ